MNPAFEKHAAYMAQAWRTLQDSVLLKETREEATRRLLPVTPPSRKWKEERLANLEESQQSHTLPNIQRIVANRPGAADARHCESQGCQAMVKPGNSYCAACLERGDATDAQGIDPEGNYGTGRND